MSERGRRAPAVCAQCWDIFTRVAYELRRQPRHFCSKACRNESFRTGIPTVKIRCSGCAAMFDRSESEARRVSRQGGRTFCSQKCYCRHVDRGALARLSRGKPRQVDPEVAAARARLGGLARARALSKEKLREISLLGVAARLQAKPVLPENVRKARDRVTRRAGALLAFGVRLGKRI